MTDYALVLSAIYPSAEWSLSGSDYDSLQWFSDTPKPSKDELDAAWPAVKSASDIAVIQQIRAARYRMETDPLFFKAQRGEDGVTLQDWQAAVDAIRADLPYPS